MIKLIFYQKNSNKPIVLTDSGSVLSSLNLPQYINELLSSGKVCQIDTENDTFIFNPSEIAGVMISDGKRNEHSETEETIYHKQLRSK